MESLEQARELRQTLSLVVPVYFNADSLPTLADDLRRFETRLAELGVGLELIFVDDGSADQSLARLLDIKRDRPTTKVIRLSRNFGAPAAAKAGLAFVTGDGFAFWAADLQEPLPQLMQMVECWLAGDKFVVSVRTSRADPAATRFFSALFAGIVRATISRNYPSGGAGLVLMDRVMLAPMKASPKNNNPNVYAFWLGFAPKIMHYERLKRVHGRNRWTFLKRLKYMSDTMTGFSVLPLRVITAIGLIIALVSFVYAAFIVAVALANRIPVGGFATIMTVVAFLGGCTLLMLGIIGEYIWRIFDQISGRPESVIAQEFVAVDDGAADEPTRRSFRVIDRPS